MKRQVTAREAYANAVDHKPRRVVFINECPDCGGTGKDSKNRDCGTCGNEPDEPETLRKIGGYWFKK
jgi:DnaJ-class molecular chaperone